ncbi:hypothetical protein [Clostridium botulinum]|uniref:hypothetical protein n=1 Tax=Clostridium botulinum TaxID=1491 RepID=UPI00077432B7|nr:hypothetical protein [Clostridium botulinum]
MYKCIKGFFIERRISGNVEYVVVKEDSIWNSSEDKDRAIDASAIRLKNDNSEWIEMLPEELEEKFELIK